jgi:fucose 4-O-acetylase-like acetyltransferase
MKIFNGIKASVYRFFIMKTLKKVAKENNMLGTILRWLDGKKTYLFSIAYFIQKLGVASGWWEENAAVEAFLLSGGAMSLREGVKKAEKT